MQEEVDVFRLYFLKESKMSRIDPDKRNIREVVLMNGMDECAVSADADIQLCLIRIGRLNTEAVFCQAFREQKSDLP